MESIRPETLVRIKELAHTLRIINKRKAPYFSPKAPIFTQRNFAHFLRAAVLIEELGVGVIDFLDAVRETAVRLKRTKSKDIQPFYLYSHRTILTYKRKIAERSILAEVNAAPHISRLVLVKGEDDVEGAALAFVFRKYLNNEALARVAPYIELDDEDRARLTVED